MKTANSRVICSGELDAFSLKIAWGLVPVEILKDIAQSLRENVDWYGYSHNNCGEMLNAIMEVIHISEKKFKTTFKPAI